MEKESRCLGPRALKQLVGRRTVLIEVACSPESRLTSMIQKLIGHEDAAIRCSHWNGCDLGTQAGVDMILNTIDTHRPEHVWISPNCGPYSPLQSINQRSEAQIAQLAEKRRVALQQYTGAKCVYEYCIQHGIHVTWEWSQKCQGWRLPIMQDLSLIHI